MIFKQIGQVGDGASKINYNLVGRKYYVVSGSSGVLAADFRIGSGEKKEEFIVTRNMDSSANINEQSK